jgi:hypothetical protein
MIIIFCNKMNDSLLITKKFSLLLYYTSWIIRIFICQCNHFDGEIFIMLDSSVTDHWFKLQLDHTKDNKNGTDQNVY